MGSFSWWQCLIVSLTVIVCSVNLGCAATLATDEVEALKQIARTLGKKDWNFKVDPCNSNESSWFTPAERPENQVVCDCSYDNNTTCHVVRIFLKSQNLDGNVPPELVRLPYLVGIDLTRNYLNGTIPREWGTMQLVNISLPGNRVTGGLPIELANISTLLYLTLDYNQLGGNIPPQFGNFSRIEKLSLSSNNLTGELPQSLAKLTTLKDFRINDNNFSGHIPNFIQNWKSLERLEIQGSGLRGPIPSGIASMANLSDLKISDLNGGESNFPLPINNINFKNLILRSCNIIGQLPRDLEKMSNLKILDLSFNKLNGQIPETFSRLSKVDYIYLTGNSLTGPIPNLMLQKVENFDLSYNNLDPGSIGSDCQPRKVNLFASSKGNKTGIVSCLERRGCPRMYHSLHINCGGEVKYDDKGTLYEEDKVSGGPSNFVPSATNWGFSSTGHFLEDDSDDFYIKANKSSISGKNPQLYMDARLSPLSLSYYAFCLVNGNYTINLHFAEIMFTKGRNYSSLGRRVFDVYIQGQQVLWDFNIEYEAGGVNIGIVRSFPALVTDNTLDIRFYWAGKGTTGIPNYGVYGPLISAISVINPDFPVRKSLSAGTIIGIVIAVLFTVLLVLSVLWWRGCLISKNILEQDLKGLGQHTGIFTLRQIRAATNNFDPANKIGEGGFGPVYKGLSDGTIIAVKQLSSKSKQGNREFVNEIGLISALQHPHLVKLYGCCIEGNQLLLVYEYMENNSLARALFSQEKHSSKLDWPTRHNICIGIARGLAYLHEESRLKIVHRDIKATNVLLDKKFNAKISDFGLAKLDEEDNTHISTRIAGTFGYMAPEYAMRGYLTDKADVYSFGVVLLEIVSGRSNTSIKLKEGRFYLLDWANSLKVEGKLMELVDSSLESNFNEEEVITTINLALSCTNVVATERPSMSAVVNILEGRARVEEFVSDSSASFDKTKSKEITSQDQVNNSSISMDMPWTSSSKSVSELYPITLDTDNKWENFESLT